MSFEKAGCSQFGLQLENIQNTPGSSKGNKLVRAELMEAVGRNGEFAVYIIYAMDEAFTNVNFNPLTDEKSYRESEPAEKVENT